MRAGQPKRSSLLRYAVMLIGDRELALDITQEAMARAALRWLRISEADRPELYVKRMLTNEYLTWRRGPWFRRVVLRDEPAADWRDGSTVVPDHAEHAVRRDEVWALLAGLPRQQRAALVLRYYESLTEPGDRRCARLQGPHRPRLYRCSGPAGGISPARRPWTTCGSDTTWPTATWIGSGTSSSYRPRWWPGGQSGRADQSGSARPGAARRR